MYLWRNVRNENVSFALIGLDCQHQRCGARCTEWSQHSSWNAHRRCRAEIPTINPNMFFCTISSQASATSRFDIFTSRCDKLGRFYYAPYLDTLVLAKTFHPVISSSLDSALDISLPCPKPSGLNHQSHLVARISNHGKWVERGGIAPSLI